MSNNPWLFPLPEVVNPPTLCLQIEIPNDQNHIAAFLGMLERLATWFRWQRDDAHTGLAASDVWKLILSDVAQQIFLGGNCPVDTGFAGADDGSEFMIRQNPDNPCLLESSVNGTDWCVFADISKCMNFGSQPGTGTTPPAPGGGTQQTCTKLNANSTLLLPVVVNTGDTITLNSVAGAGYDGVEFDFGPLWRCPNGDQFVGGLDVGFPTTKSGDPMPAVNHMSIIMGFGATPGYLALPVGVPVTIPDGVSNAQLWVQVNDSGLADNLGSYDICVTVKNNQTGSWTHTFDFTESAKDWFAYPALGSATVGEWLPGIGWQDTDVTAVGHNARGVAIQRNFTSIDLDQIIVNFNFTLGTVDSSGTVVQAVANNVSGQFSITRDNAVQGTNKLLADNTSDVGVTQINIQFLSDYTVSGIQSGSVLITSIQVKGHGTNPFA